MKNRSEFRKRNVRPRLLKLDQAADHLGKQDKELGTPEEEADAAVARIVKKLEEIRAQN